MFKESKLIKDNEYMKNKVEALDGLAILYERLRKELSYNIDNKNIILKQDINEYEMDKIIKYHEFISNYKNSDMNYEEKRDLASKISKSFILDNKSKYVNNDNIKNVKFEILENLDMNIRAIHVEMDLILQDIL